MSAGRDQAVAEAVTNRITGPIDRDRHAVSFSGVLRSSLAS